MNRTLGSDWGQEEVAGYVVTQRANSKLSLRLSVCQSSLPVA